MGNLRNRTQGFAVAVVLLVTAVALAAAVSAALISSVTSRQVASQEGRSTAALFAAESGLNTLLARANTSEYEYDHGSVGAWLNAVGLSEYELPAGARVRLSAHPNADPDTVTIRSEGIAAGGSVRVIYQDFDLGEADAGWANPNDAALVTIPPLKTNSKKSRLIGLEDTADAWTFEGHDARDAFVGEYVVISGTNYRVTAVAEDGSTVGLETTGEDPATSTVPGGTEVALVPFALAAPHAGPFVSPTTLAVTNPDKYPAGTEIKVGEFGVGTVSSSTDTEIVVTWKTPPLHPLTEGMPVRKVVPSALAQTGGCPAESGKLDEKLPQGCHDGDLGDLFASTFPGYTKSELRDLAENDDDDLPSRVYTKSSGSSWPSGPVSGLTWIDGASTGDANSKALCGTGVVVLNTGPSLDDEVGSININVSDGCEFRGVLYVMGQLSLAGNLDSFSGTILTEGPGQFTNVQGKGEKSLYDPIAVRKAMNLLDFETSAGLFAAIPSTWRFGE